MDVLILFTEWNLDEMSDEQVRQMLAYELSWAMDDVVREVNDAVDRADLEDNLLSQSTSSCMRRIP